MIVMLDKGKGLDIAEAELRCNVEQLLTPLTRYLPFRLHAHFAIDNGAFSRFDRKAFEALLIRELPRKSLCRFVAVPDVVGSARRTAEVFDYWFPLLGQWSLAFVCQDGQDDLPIPFDHIDAMFIGGTTKFKESDAAIACIKAAKAIGKWVHVGRVNDPVRFERFEQLGVDSVDGTGIAFYSHMREKIASRNGDHRLFRTEEMMCKQKTYSTDLRGR